MGGGGCVCKKQIEYHLISMFLSHQDSLDFGTLMVSGYLRGTTSLSVNDLVHIPGFGNFQMSCIKMSKDPYVIEQVERKRYLSDDKMRTERTNETVILTADPEKQVSCTYFNIDDFS